MTISRIAANLAVATVLLALPHAAPAQQSGGVLRVIPHSNLAILDPIWTTAYMSRNHGYMIYDTLFGTDEKLNVRPQMVDKHSVSKDGMKYSFTLRDGLKWHDGQPVVAEDCVESLKRWMKKDRFGRLLAAHGPKLAPADRRTFTLELGERFGPVLEALGKPSSNVPFMMPARIAATSADEQIKEIVGSGPFRFVKDDWQPGNQVVYVKHGDYVPRNEAPSGSAGGKKVNLDKVVWRYMPDAATASAALAAGEIDWWELPPIDFIAKIEQTPALATFLPDTLGTQGWLRPNHLHPPFNNKKARQALVAMMNQETYLQAAIGVPKYYRTCASVFACGGPYASPTGAEGLARQNLERARQLVKESGYDGRPITVVHITDISFLNAAALVTRELLTAAGFNVDLKAMDWSTGLAVRAKKDPPDKGGWNVLHTWWMAADVMHPAVHFGVSGAGAGAWFGWPEIPRLEQLITDFVRAGDAPRRKALAAEVQKVALDEVAYVPWGEWTQPTAHRKSVTGILKFIAPLFWNVSTA